MVIDAKTKKEDVLKLVRNSCRKCGHCCTYGSGIVLKDEVAELAKKLNLDKDKFVKECLEEFEKFNTRHFRFKQIRKDLPYGRCIFFDSKNKICHIHYHKPLHCKVSTCSQLGPEVQKWFDVTFFLDKKDKASVAQYKIYAQFNGFLPGSEPEPEKRNLRT